MSDESSDDSAVVEVYWRPGCMFCMSLRRQLHGSGLPVREVNIWDDPEAAARVRSVAGGNETVPTVFVGPRAMVNPSIEQVLAAVREHHPQLAEGVTVVSRPAWQPLLGSVGFALLWLLLASRSADTTYHVAPLLVAGAGPVTARWLGNRPLPPDRALRLALAGLAIALGVAAVLAVAGRLAGPDLTGGHSAGTETVLVAAIGAVLGWWIAQRGHRTTAT